MKNLFCVKKKLPSTGRGSSIGKALQIKSKVVGACAFFNWLDKLQSYSICFNQWKIPISKHIVILKTKKHIKFRDKFYGLRKYNLCVD